MYASPFDANRFPDAPAIPDPDSISIEAAMVLHRLRGTLPDPVNWNASVPMEMSTALARAIFDHEAARLTLDLPDDRMDLPIALHQDDPRLLQLLDTARHIRQRDPSQWPMLMDMALEAVQAETADIMHLDGDGLQARDLDNQNLPLYETIHEDMLDHRLETRYQGILNPGTLAAPLASPWMPPLPGTYRGVLPVRPSPLPGATPLPAAELPEVLRASPEFPAYPEQPQPQLAERSAVMPDYQIREIIDPETQQVSYQTELNQVSQNLRGGSRIWGMDAENDTLPLRAFDSPEAAQAQLDALQDMEPLREALRNLEPVTVAGVPYDPVRDADGNVYSFLARNGMDRTDLPWISTWELQQYAHTGTLTPELAVQQLQSAEDSGYAFSPFETIALQAFARDANADPRFTAYQKQEGEYMVVRGGVRSSARDFSLDDLPRTVRDYVQAHRFDLDRTQRSENREQRQETPASARTTETGLRLQDLHLPDINRQPMRVDAAFRDTSFVRAFNNTPDALAFMAWINDQKEQRAALDRGEPLTLGQLRYVPAGVPGEYRATNAETGQAIDRQIIDQSTLQDLLHNGVVQEDLAQQWQTRPDLLATAMQTLIHHRQAGMYDYATVADQISRYAPDGIINPSRMRVPIPEPAVNSAPAPGAVLVPTAAEQQAAVLQPAVLQPAATTANSPQDMEGYRDEITPNVAPADRPAAIEPDDGNSRTTPVVQEKTQGAQQEGQEAQQKDQKAQQENQAANNGKNQKGQGQGQNQSSDKQDASKPGGFGLFSRVHQHHHYQEPPAGATAENAPGRDAPVPDAPQVSKRDALGVMDMINQAPVSPDEINVMNNRVKKEGLTPEIQDGIQNLSERGQRDVKNQKLTPEQLQKNAHALNQLGDTVNNQPDSPQKKAIMEHIQKLGQMLMEAIKRIFHLGRASTGPSM